MLGKIHLNNLICDLYRVKTGIVKSTLPTAYIKDHIFLMLEPQNRKNKIPLPKCLVKL
jgi:hypothetical protein